MKLTNDGFYELGCYTLYRSGFDIDNLVDPKVIFEFGSYDGGDGARFKNRFLDCRVISIEADPVRYEIIKEMNESLDLELELFNFAVSDVDGEIDFYPTLDPNEKNPDGIGGSGSIHKKTQKYKDTYSHLEELEPTKVQSKTLQTLCKELGIEEIDFLHMDVEGAEFKVLRGMWMLRPKMIFLEKHLGSDMYEGAYQWDHMAAYLKYLGYSLAAESPSDAIFIFDEK
jgi:FkbM family methyltransferase